MTHPRVLTVIPARGGSKGVPRKNIKPLDGLPLIGHVYRAACAVAGLEDIVLSTDDTEVAQIAEGLGLAVPFLRPPELASDTASSYGVVRHVLEEMESRRGTRYDAALLLQPTCPFTRADHLRQALELMWQGGYDFVGSVTPVVDEHPAYMLTRGEDGRYARAFPQYPATAPRQLLPPFFTRCGNVYLSRRELIDNGSLIGENASYIVVDRMDAININDPFDWMVAEARCRMEAP